MPTTSRRADPLRPRRRAARVRFARLAAAVLVSVAMAGVSVLVRPAEAGAVAGFRHACAPAHGQVVTCFAVYDAAASPPPARRDAPPKLTPRDIAAAYRLPADNLGNGTVGIVDAFDDPSAEHDLAVYRKRFGLPACTTANGCFRKVNQAGRPRPLPQGDADWAVEISLDLDAVSAACPGCHILLVEADEPETPNLGRAENTAVRLGADVVSNSYGTDEFAGMGKVARRYYLHAGVPIVASTGDDGFTTAQFPAVMRFVIAVGGTSLTKTRHGWAEHAWWGAGSGCSAYLPKPRWQPGTHCPMRSVSDISAVADPASGFLLYDTYRLGRQAGYHRVGGTSLSAPLIAGMIARAGNAAHVGGRYISRHRHALHDVRGGSTGFCGGDYLCTAKIGYDLPTGFGSPRGLGAL